MQYISFIFSAIALTVSVFGLLENRRNNRIGNSPRLTGHEIATPFGYAYEVQNKGTGHAYFTKVEFFLDKRPLSDIPLAEALRRALDEAGVPCELSVTQPAQHGVLQAGEVLQIVNISVKPEHASKLKAIPSDRFGARISYVSAHGNSLQWSTDGRLLTTSV